MGEQQYNWSQRSIDELEQFAIDTILPEYRAAAPDTDRSYPTAAWLRDHGYSGIRYALREHHDRTLTDFFQELVDEPDSDDDRRFGIADDTTEAALDAYFTRREQRDLLADSTLASRRSRVRRWIEQYRAAHGTDALVPSAADADDKAPERARARAVLDVIAADLSTDRSRFAFVADVRAVYSWLEREGYIAFNPLSNIEAEYDWDRTEPDNTALEPTDIRTLLETATTEARELLVVALAGWGLRPSEVASLHVSQFVLEGNDPHIAFEDRKNGPGTVALLVGRAVVDDRIDTLALDIEDWNGYLFPSTASADGHVVADTIRNWFTDLTATADVTIDGSPATPKTARRFWYSAYSRAHVRLMDDMDQIADEQGAESGRVVWENYLSEADRRRRRRQEMRQELDAVFDFGE